MLRINTKIYFIIFVLNFYFINIVLAEKKITDVFKHEKHSKIIEENKLDCMLCHPQHNEKTDFKDACHACHRDKKYKTKAPTRCFLCHKELKKIKPKSHTNYWKENHAVNAKLDNFSCEKCHFTSFCNDCHKKRDELRQRVHKRSFVFYHSVEVRANPNKCASCHNTKFCTDCHSTRGVR
jgi:hypothetical protein